MDDEKIAGGLSALTEVLELLPCPFCGNAASPTIRKTLEHIEQSIFAGGYMVICDAATWNDKHGCGASSGWNETAIEAAEDWNTRSNV